MVKIFYRMRKFILRKIVRCSLTEEELTQEEAYAQCERRMKEIELRRKIYKEMRERRILELRGEKEEGYYSEDEDDEGMDINLLMMRI